MSDLDGIEREIGTDPDLSIIWLHGLGADASDFLPIIGALQLPADTRFVFPNAPRRPVTINGGMTMRAWYDITGFGPDVTEDTRGLRESVESVRGLVVRELERGISADRVVLAGFSQGGAVVLHAGLGSDVTLGGILGLSTYLPARTQLPGPDAVRTDVPVMLAHGNHDPVIPLGVAKDSSNYLASLGVAVDWSVYVMGHEVVFDEIRKISDWLRRFQSR